MFSVHHISFACQFGFAMDLVKLFPDDLLKMFLFSNNGTRLLYCCLLSDEAFNLGNFLLERYIFTMCQLVCEELRDEEESEWHDLFDKNIATIVHACKSDKHSSLLLNNSSLELLDDFIRHCVLLKNLYPDFPIFYQFCKRGKSIFVKTILDYDLLDSSCLTGTTNLTPLYCIAAGGHFDILKDVSLKFPFIFDSQRSTLYTTQFGALFYLCLSNYYNKPNILMKKLDHHYKHLFLPHAFTLGNLHKLKNTSAMYDFLKLCFSQTEFSINEESADIFVILLLLIPNLSAVMIHLDDTFVTNVFETQQKQSWFYSKNLYEMGKQNFSDWMLQDLPSYNNHPCPNEFVSLLDKLLSRFPPFNPISIVHKGYHQTLEKSVLYLDQFACSHKRYSVILKKWQLALFDIIRLGHGELAIHILKTLNSISVFQHIVDLKGLLSVAVGHKDSFNANILEHLLDLNPVKQVFISTVKCAATRGNVEAIKILVTCNKPAVELEFPSILCSAAKSGKSVVVDYFYENQYSSFVHDTTNYFNHDTKFWLAVFKNAVHSGHKELALSAVGNMPLHAMTSLSSADVLYNVCWWGMVDVLSTLCVEDSKLFFKDVKNSTPFQAALDNGQISKFSEIDCFPTFLSIILSSDVEMLEKSLPQKGLACRFSHGWLATVVATRADSEESHLFNNCRISTILLVEELENLFPNVYFFLEALITPIGYNVVDSFIKTWGKHASGVLYYLHKKLSTNVLALAVLGGNVQTVQVILQILFDAEVVNDFVTLSIFQTALLKNDVQVLKLLKMFCDAKTVAILKREKSGETILHIVSEYSQSLEGASVVLSMITNHVSKLVNSPDRTNMNPLQCAIILGRHYVAQELIGSTPFISDEDKKFLERAFGWFEILMSINADKAANVNQFDEQQEMALSMLAVCCWPSIREKSIPAYYNIFKNIHRGVAESMMRASCGVLPLSGLDHLTNPNTLLDASLAVNRQKWISFMKNKEILLWCRMGQFNAVTNIIKYILFSNESDLLETSIVNELFVIACSSGGISFVEYIINGLLATGAIAKSAIVKGFVTAIGMGQLEVAAYIMVNGGVTQGQLKQELVKVCKPPFIVNLIFFSPAHDICKILQNVIKQGNSSRALVAQIWMMHDWGKYQIQMIENRIRHASLYTRHVEVGLVETPLTVDVSSFPDFETVCCPLAKLVVVLSSCVGHFVSIWRYPPTVSLKHIQEKMTATTISCDLFSSLPRYERSSYNSNIILAFDQQDMVLKWPADLTEQEEEDSFTPKESSNEITKLFTIPSEQLVKMSAQSCLLNTKDLLVPIHIDCKGLVSCTDCSEQLLCTLKQCINDVLSVFKLYRYTYSLYTELGIVSKEFLEQYQYKQLQLNLPLPNIIDEVYIEVGFGKNEVITHSNSDGRFFNIAIGIDGNADTGLICPSSDQLMNIVGSAIVNEISHKYSRVLYHYLEEMPYSVTVCTYDEDSGVMADLTNHSELSLKDVVLLQFMYSIKKFVDLLIVTIRSCFSDSSSDSTSMGEIKLLLKLKNSDSYYDVSKKCFSVYILDILPHRRKGILSVVIRDFVQHTHMPEVCLSNPIAVASYIDLNENFEFFMTLKNGYATICTIEGKPVDKVKLKCKRKSNTKHLHIASAKINGTYVQNSPLVFHFKDKYLFTTQTKNRMTLIVTHPGGRCQADIRPRIVMNENYTSVRDKVSPKKTPLKTVSTSIENDCIHYIGVVYGKKRIDKQYLGAGVEVLLVSDKCKEPRNFHIVGYMMGAGVHQIVIRGGYSRYGQAFVGSVVAVCHNCKCCMRMYSQNGHSFSHNVRFV